jgi:glucosamine kinase
MSAILCVVDGGASGTRVRLHGPDGAALGEGAAGPSSLTLGVEWAWASIRAAVAEAAAAAGLPSRGGPGWRVAAGLAGSRSPGRRRAFLDANPLSCEVVLVSDGYASLLGALGGEPGSVVAVGTGIAARRLHPDGRTTAIAGWGFPAADEGSGAWIGLRAVQAHLRRRDGRAVEPSALLDEVGRRLGPTREAALDWLLAADSTAYAALAPSVVAAAARGDGLARRILDEAAREVGATVDALDGGEPGGPLALLGGLAPVMAERLAPAHAARLVPPRGTALDGALRILTGRAPLEAA